MDNKAYKPRYFKKTFLLANISIDIVLRMSFLTLSNIEINFLVQKLNWGLDIT